MAIYTDPRTGQQRTTDDLGRTSYASSWGIVLALIIAIALAWASFGNTSRTVDQTNTGASTTSEPVTTPSSPNASPTHPAPSPNPGP